nr:MAG TPA: hypothetical protein [Caudoviricetes sp.]
MSLHRKNQAHKMLGWSLKVFQQSTDTIILSRQLDYSTFGNLSQPGKCERRMIYVYFSYMDYR